MIFYGIENDHYPKKISTWSIYGTLSNSATLEQERYFVLCVLACKYCVRIMVKN